MQFSHIDNLHSESINQSMRVRNYLSLTDREYYEECARDLLKAYFDLEANMTNPAKGYMFFYQLERFNSFRNPRSERA